MFVQITNSLATISNLSQKWCQTEKLCVIFFDGNWLGLCVKFSDTYIYGKCDVLVVWFDSILKRKILFSYFGNCSTQIKKMDDGSNKNENETKRDIKWKAAIEKLFWWELIRNCVCSSSCDHHSFFVLCFLSFISNHIENNLWCIEILWSSN